MAHLPASRGEMAERGWDELDFLFISGDAYVDHPSFGAAILTRLLESKGFRVGILAQPSMEDPSAFLEMGRPRLAVLVSSGVVDSMVDNYTASRKPRTDDLYSPGGIGGRRPDRALIKYCGKVRDLWGDVPLIIGGVEASLRRFAHYDYWSRQVRRSVLQDSQADLLIFGMGEIPLLEVAALLDKGVPVRRINSIRGTCILAKPEQLPAATAEFISQTPDFFLDSSSKSREELLGRALPQDRRYVLLPSFEESSRDKTAYAVAFRNQYREQDPMDGRTLIQKHSGRFLVQNPPQRLMTTQELDQVYDLPYERSPHPRYQAEGGVPAIEEVRFSITSHRGCFGGCHFCAIGFLQGRIVQHRSAASILREAELLTKMPDFKGYIHDVGGPTANFYNPACARQREGHACRDRQCLFPEPCPHLEADHGEYLGILRKIRALPGVKKVFIRSGIRFDYLCMDEMNDAMTEICRYHVSGQLKVAPEHVSSRALKMMGKPPPEKYRAFCEKFKLTNQRLGLKQFLVPYLISGHPGCGLEDAIELALEIQAGGVMPEQVQAFYPTPGTLSTTMYYTGLNPLTLEAVHVPDERESTLQRALLQFGRPENREKVLAALRLAGRTDLIGYGPGKLVTPRIKKKSSDTSTTRPREANQNGHHHQREGTGSGDPGKSRGGRRPPVR
jgi:uncharacterized radical SAM protein YgiQ